ncbi:hypothetical protein GCM10028790_45870 [Micromonospora taraxaci]
MATTTAVASQENRSSLVSTVANLRLTTADTPPPSALGAVGSWLGLGSPVTSTILAGSALGLCAVDALVTRRS